jgi:hypothetical protein
MPDSISSAIADLSSSESSRRAAAAAVIYSLGRSAADRATLPWWHDAELSKLLLGAEPHVTVGIAVQTETFERIHAANGSPTLANVPPEQDAEEFELHFPDGVALDVLTARDSSGQGAIARFLSRFGEGVQQVEFRCLNVRRAAAILRDRFATNAVYPEARAGAGGTRINFFLLPVPETTGGNSKILIELYELPENDRLTDKHNP